MIGDFTLQSMVEIHLRAVLTALLFLLGIK